MAQANPCTISGEVATRHNGFWGMTLIDNNDTKNNSHLSPVSGRCVLWLNGPLMRTEAEYECGVTISIGTIFDPLGP